MIVCEHHRQNRCRSCAWLDYSYEKQLAEKQQHLSRLLAQSSCENAVWHPPFSSPLTHFRNKAKMVVGGSVERPLLGILRDPNNPHPVVDLSDCPLYPNDFCHLFPILKDFIGRAGLVPYNIAKQKGELKYLLLTKSYATKELMLRFVLRSEQKLPLIRRELEGLLTKLPQLTVVSVNIQPQHAAILEGEKEIFLTRQEMLPEYFNQIPLFIRPQGFFQTNPVVAQALYRTAQIWTQGLPIKRLWDLFVARAVSVYIVLGLCRINGRDRSN